MTAFLGAIIAKKLKKPLYLDIRDIFWIQFNIYYPNIANGSYYLL